MDQGRLSLDRVVQLCCTDPAKLAAELRSHRGVKAVFFQQAETSTGAVNDVQALAETVRRHSDAVIVLDAISSLGGEPLETDAWGLDVVLSASQKGLMCAPGLAFASVSERAWELSATARLPRFYLDWRAMREALPDGGAPFTPAINLVAGQATSLRLLLEEGLEKAWARTAELARHARKRARELGLELVAEAPSNVLTALRTPPEIDPDALIADILEKDGVAIARGMGRLKGKTVRVAHMGHISRAELDAGFDALRRRMPREGEH